MEKMRFMGRIPGRDGDVQQRYSFHCMIQTNQTKQLASCVNAGYLNADALSCHCSRIHIMRNIPVFLLAALCTPALVVGQSLTVGGTIRDKQSAAPIPLVRCDIVNKANPSEHYTTGTNSAGEWQYTIIMNGVEGDPAVPQELRLGQNYPNPFNPSTKIGFSVNRAGSVRLRAYTILGQVLDSHVFTATPGTYEVTWSATGSAGVIFYEIESGGARMVRKMVQLDAGRGEGWGEVRSLGGVAYRTSGNRDASTFSVLATKLAYEPDSAEFILADGVRTDLLLETVHQRALVADLHNDVMEVAISGYDMGVRHTTHHSDLPRWRDGGMDLQIISVWVDPDITPPYNQANKIIDSLEAQLARNASVFAKATSADEATAIIAVGKMAGVIGVEGGHAIEDDIGKLKALYTRGARYLTLTWNNSTSWAVSAQDARSSTTGLSDFGKEVIRTMDTLGMMIDVSHVGIKTIQDVLTVTTHPIIASHSGARAIHNHYRNLTDAQIRAIAQSGGVIGVVFYPSFLNGTSHAAIADVVAHIDYIKNLVGVDYVALGSDFDGIETVPVGLEDVSHFPALTLALFNKGYTRSEVRKILGENFLRVFKTVCR
jgi:membrane dipeptidase